MTFPAGQSTFRRRSSHSSTSTSTYPASSATLRSAPGFRLQQPTNLSTLLCCRPNGPVRRLSNQLCPPTTRSFCSFMDQTRVLRRLTLSYHIWCACPTDDRAVSRSFPWIFPAQAMSTRSTMKRSGFYPLLYLALLSLYVCVRTSPVSPFPTTCFS